MRKATYFGTAAALAVACLTGSSLVPPTVSEAAAREFMFYPDRGYYYPDRSYRSYRPRRPDFDRPARRQPAAKQAERQKDPPPPPGPHLLVVSVKSQKIALYANGKLVTESPVSTGMPTHPTPHGVFSIIQRNRHHRSNIYSGAPMPYMQRLTWSGIALHQGALPGHPASHGCIRLPEKFASFLWRTTRLGARVVVSREDTAPYDVAHARLFQPKSVPTTVESAPDLRRTLDTTTPAFTRTAGMTVMMTDGSNSAETKPAAEAAQAAATTPAEAENGASSAEIAKEESTASLYPQKADIPDDILDSFAQSLQAKQKKAAPSGPVSVFISRKEKRLFVRQGFIPLFTADVSFRDENAIFGTHVLTAVQKDDDSKQLRWLAVTLPPELPKAESVKPAFKLDARGRRVEVPVKQQVKSAGLQPVPSITSVLDRIDIPQDVVDRISEYVTAGASLIVSDHGLGHETGLYTDFIVVTR